MSRRDEMNSRISSEVSSAYTWSPRNSTRSGHRRSSFAIWSAYARMASTPWLRLPAASCETLVRHEPNASRRSLPGFSVAIRLGGYGESAGGQTCSSSIATV